MNLTRSPRGCVLITDDDGELRSMLAGLLRKHGLEVHEAQDGDETLGLLLKTPIRVILLDLRMPGMSGLEVLREALKIDPSLSIILMTAHGSIDSAVAAVKAGAYDYLSKPFVRQDLLLKVDRALGANQLKKENQRLRSQVGGEPSLREEMGSSEAIRRVLADVERVAPTDFTVVITGETGAGKELVAKAVHRLSARAGGPFIPVDCGSIPATLIESELFGHEKGAFTGADKPRRGAFEMATGGTLFLDEMANLPLLMQAKLLRALQERKISRVGSHAVIDLDVRVLAASNEGLAQLTAAGRFRRDLYHRLGEYHIKVPPLRERRGDIVFLARRFLEITREELNKGPLDISVEAQQQLLDYPWPGNVRELRNVVRRAVLLADNLVRPEHLGLKSFSSELLRQDLAEPAAEPAIDGRTSLWDMVRGNVAQVERTILLRALRQTGGNKARAARLLQIDYKTMRYKTKEYGLSLDKGDNNHEHPA